MVAYSSAELLKDAGLRVTAPRLATIEVIMQHPHSDAERVATEVRKKLGTVSRQAVYDVLSALHGAGVFRKITPQGRAALYELDSHDNHHHFLCDGCGRLDDVPCAVGSAPCLVPHGLEGSSIYVADVLYRGLCAECTADQAQKMTNE